MNRTSDEIIEKSKILNQRIDAEDERRERRERETSQIGPLPF